MHKFGRDRKENKFFINKIHAFPVKCKSLILNTKILAITTCILWNPAQALALRLVKSHLSTKLSTVIVDSGKSAYKSGCYVITSCFT
jgi:hypothetical protein